MKKALLILVCLGFTMLAVPCLSPAFEAYQCGDQQITVWGFIRNNLGVFEHTQEYVNSGNQLATARTWLRGYLEWKMGTQFKFYTAVQFVWEPWYKVEEGTTQSENGGAQQHRRSGWKTYSEFDDVNDVIREVYVEWKPNKTNSIKFGRQIAIWGESLVDRVGDVIHPNDSRFSFAFANLEDTRIPQYMIRGIHDFPSINSSFEWIINPLLTEGQYTVNRSAEYYNQEADGGAEQRFALYPEDRYYPGRTYPLYSAGAPFSVIPGTRYDPADLTGWPIASSAGLSFYTVLVGVGPFGPIYTTFPWYAFNEMPSVRVKYPDNFEDTRFGFRTSTVLAGYQFGFSYWHSHTFDPVMSRGGYIGRTANPVYVNPFVTPNEPSTLPVREYELYYPTMDYIGFYMNKQLPWPGVIRAEAVYSPNKPYSDFNCGATENCVVRRDYVKYMLAYDLNSFFYFDWHKTAPFDITFEHVGEWVPNSSEIQQAIYVDKVPNYHASFNIRISTNWYYNRFATDVVFGYDTFGNSGLFMPTVKWMPGWMNSKFSAELKYIGIYGDNDYSGISMFRKKDMLILTTQFNF